MGKDRWVITFTFKFNLSLLFPNHFPDFDDSKAGDRFVKLLITEAPQYEIVNVNDPDNIEIPSFYDRELFQKSVNVHSSIVLGD